MSKVRFVGLDVHAETIAVAVAESGGEVRSLGIIPNRPESVRKLVQKLGPDLRSPQWITCHHLVATQPRLSESRFCRVDISRP